MFINGALPFINGALSFVNGALIFVNGALIFVNGDFPFMKWCLYFHIWCLYLYKCSHNFCKLCFFFVKMVPRLHLNGAPISKMVHLLLMSVSTDLRGD